MTHAPSSALPIAELIPAHAGPDRISYRWILSGAVLLMNTDALLRSGQSGATIYLAEAAIWLAAACIFFSEYFVFRRDVLTSAIQRTPIEFSYLAWCALLALFAVAYSGSADLLGKVKNLLPGFMLGVLIVHTVHTPKSVNAILAFLTIGLVGNAIYGVLQFLGVLPYAVTPLANNVWKTDIFGEVLPYTANGFFLSPNNLGVSLIPGVLISLAYLSQSVRMKKWWVSVGFTILLCVLLTGLYATQNKGCFIWAIFGGFFCITKVRFRALLAVLLLALIVVALSNYGADRFSAPDTLAVRIQLWLAAQRAIFDDTTIFLVGDGLRKMPYWGATLARWSIESSHNTWLDQVLMYGVIGALLYAAMWTKSIVLAAQAQESEFAWSRAASAGVFGSLVALAGALFFEPRADGVNQVAQVFILFALARSLWRASLVSRPRSESVGISAGIAPMP